MTDELDRLLEVDLNDPETRLAIHLVAEDSAVIPKLVAIRKAKGMSQTDVARELGLAQSTVAQFESNAHDPRLSTIRRYAHAVGAKIFHRIESVGE